MAITYTFHGPNRPGEAVGTPVDALGPQIGNATSVADGAASAALSATGFYRIAATSSCTVMISSSATDGANGGFWPFGCVEVRYIEAGQKIGCSAA